MKNVWDHRRRCPSPGAGPSEAFYIEKVGLQVVESHFLKASDGRVGLAAGDGVNQLVLYPARVRS